MNKAVFGLLITFSCISVFLTVVQKTPTPPCLNADEAAFGYNAYSILKTGRDEYGKLFPLRLKSFGDYKMPLYTYFSVPFVAIFGLNEFGIRALNVFLSFILPFAVYLLSYELFKNKKVGLVSSFLVTVSLGLHIIARHAHEAYLATVLTTFVSYFFLRILQKPQLKNIFFFGLLSILLLFSYHPGRLFILFFLGFAILHALIHKKHSQIGIIILLLLIIGLFSLSDFIYKPERLKNLVFFNNAGFSLKISELKTEGGIKYLYHPLFIGLKDVLLAHLTYFSPQFLLLNGDENYRFGYPGMGVLTVIEYGFIFIGIYYLFKNKEKWRWFILLLTFFSPFSSSLSWSTGSLTRSLFLFIPLAILSGYGFTQLGILLKKQHLLFYLVTLSTFCFFLIFNWDFYLFHFPRRLTTIHAWQCGYKEVSDFIKQNYNKYDTFYITRDIGMPYIFTLFYLKYPPEEYQKQASLTAPDEYGFGQVNGFDKFVFDFKPPKSLQNKSVVIGSRDNFKSLGTEVDITKLKTISTHGEPMFMIYSLDN